MKWRSVNNGCSGGMTHGAFMDAVQQHYGLVAELDLPYNDKAANASAASVCVYRSSVSSPSSSAPSPSPSGSAAAAIASISDWKQIVGRDCSASRDANVLLKRALQSQPIAVAINSAYPFTNYKGGFYSCPNGSDLASQNDVDHALVLVGYGTDVALGDYWILKNSYGHNWGEGDFMKLLVDTKTNCELNVSPVVPIGAKAGAAPPSVDGGGERRFVGLSPGAWIAVASSVTVLTLVLTAAGAVWSSKRRAAIRAQTSGDVATQYVAYRLRSMLTSAAVVCRHVPALELPHVAALVSAFLDASARSQWTLTTACARNRSLHLVRRVAARADGDAAGAFATNDLYRAHVVGAALVSAVEHDNLEMLQWLCTLLDARWGRQNQHTSFLWKAMKRAVQLGRLRALEWIADAFPDALWNPRFMDTAAKHGHLDVLRWLDAHPRYSYAACVTEKALREASRHGHVEVVTWLLTHPEFDGFLPDQALRLAIVGGHLEVAKLLFEESGFIDNLDAIDECGASGNLEMVKWIFAENIKYDLTDAMEFAGGAGHLHILQWLHEHKGETSFSRAMRRAAANGHFHVVRWLHEQGTEGCTYTLMDSAAAGGYLDIVQWLHVNRSEGCSTEAMDGAARYGHFEVVKWLHENRSEGCSTSAMDMAAWKGHLDIVQWLHENRSEGCTSGAMNWASARGNLEVVKWLHENRSEGCTTDAMNWAAAQRHLDVVEWLHENRSEGCTVGAMDTAGSVEVLRWLHEHRSEGCTTKAMDNAVYKGDFDMLLFLHAHRSEGCSADAVRHALNGRHYEILRWLNETYPSLVSGGQHELRDDVWESAILAELV